MDFEAVNRLESSSRRGIGAVDDPESLCFVERAEIAQQELCPECGQPRGSHTMDFSEQEADVLPTDACQEARPQGQSITIVHDEKINADNQHGRFADVANTNAVRGGSTDDME